MNSQQRQLKAAFEAQANEINKITGAFNTMRVLMIALIEHFEPEKKEVVLSAKAINAISDRLKFLGINVQNKKLQDDVHVSITDSETEVVMSVEPDKYGELVAETPNAPAPEPVPHLPVLCICGDTDDIHVGRTGVCKAKNCLCNGFVERKHIM